MNQEKKKQKNNYNTNEKHITKIGKQNHTQKQ